MSIVLFGSNSPSGSAYLDLCRSESLETWGRKPAKDSSISHVYCDLSKPPPASLSPIKGVIVSFAPIWLLAPYIYCMIKNTPELLGNLEGIIACSSSSFMTKRFASNNYDKNLATLLINAHETFKSISTELQVPCQILAPTLIYGQVNEFSDKNLSSITKFMSSFPLIVLPSGSGLRQPIHATQLASVAKHQSDKISKGEWQSTEPEVICLGGDSTITYFNMISILKHNLKKQCPGKKCLIITLPDRIFFFLMAPLLLIHPRLFEALMRINSNLSGFTMVHQILQEPPISFPVFPLGTQGKIH